MLTRDIPEVTEELLDEMVKKIVSHFYPEKIILFGSHAWGMPDIESDVDLLIIQESNLRPARRSAQISSACRPRGLSVDFLVKTPSEIKHQLQIGNPFLKRILEQGRILYAR